MDWGTLPDWVAALGAVVARALLWSKKSVELSRESNNTTLAAYEAEVKTRREAQARFVYSLMDVPQIINAGSKLPDLGGSRASTVAHGVFEPDLAMTSVPMHERVLARPALQMRIHVYNRSEEIIGPIALRLYDRMSRGHVTDIGMGDDTPILPGESADYTFTVVAPDTIPRFGPLLTFRDSSGQWWERENYDPIRAIDREPMYPESSSA